MLSGEFDSRLPPVHPHARGDNGAADLTYSTHTGSPPRAWGQPRAAPPCSGAERFTPTRVGTTHSRACPWRFAAVHPHARGDNAHRVAGGSVRGGSPPRAWGQPCPFIYPWRYRRFTPTRVGTTLPPLITHGLVPVHPHARGDNLLNNLFQNVYCGSPPRAWGQLRQEQP